MLSLKLQEFLKKADAPWTNVFIAKGNIKNPAPDLVWELGKETVFDLASMTKALFTAPLVHEKMDINHRLSEVFDEVLPPGIGEIKISELLSHQSGLPAWRNFWVNQLGDDKCFLKENNAAQWQRFLLRLQGLKLQKKSFCYSDIGYVFLGFALSKTQNKKLADLAADWFAGSDLAFTPKNTIKTVPTAFCKLQDVRLQGAPHDENCRSFGSVSGHAGLFGSGHGLISWLHKKSKNPLFADYMKSSVEFTGTDNSRLGWRRYGSSAGFKGGVGHYGFTGTAFMVDPSSGKYIIILSNSVFHQRNSKERTALRELVFSELGK